MEIRSFSELGTPKIIEGRTIEGYAVVFNHRSKVIYDPNKQKKFIEVIEKGAITEDLLKSCDVKAVLEHNNQRLLARSYRGMGSLHLEIDDYGLKYRFDAPNTVDGDFAVEMIRRGDIFGSSFAYYANDKDKRSVVYSIENGELLRTVRKIVRIADISPVADPAFTGTEVSVRSLQEINGLEENEDYLIELNKLLKQI